MKWWMILLFILVVLVSIIFIPHNPAHNLVLQYIYTLASWPLMILVLGLVLLVKYKDPISEWLRWLTIKTPKGYKIGPTPQDEAKPLEEKEIKEAKKKLEGETKSEKAYMEFIRFERIIRQTYRSQYELLRDLKAMGSMANDKAVSYYFEFLSRGGNKDYKITPYMKWLRETTGLIKIEEENDKWLLKLTDRGTSFIRYCNFMNYSENIFIPL